MSCLRQGQRDTQAGAQEITPVEDSAMDLESMTEEEYMEWKLKVMFPHFCTHKREKSTRIYFFWHPSRGSCMGSIEAKTECVCQ